MTAQTLGTMLCSPDIADYRIVTTDNDTVSGLIIDDTNRKVQLTTSSEIDPDPDPEP